MIEMADGPDDGPDVDDDGEIIEDGEGDEPVHPAEAAGCEAWYVCKHCDAWQEYTDEDDMADILETSVTAGMLAQRRLEQERDDARAAAARWETTAEDARGVAKRAMDGESEARAEAAELRGKVTEARGHLEGWLADYSEDSPARIDRALAALTREAASARCRFCDRADGEHDAGRERVLADAHVPAGPNPDREDADAIERAAVALIDSLGEYVRQSMDHNPEWATGARAVDAAVRARRHRLGRILAPATARSPTRDGSALGRP